MNPIVVAIDAPLPPDIRARLLALSPALRLVDGTAAAAVREAEVLFFSGRAGFDPAQAPRLRWVQFNSAGIGGLAGTPLARSGVPVASASGAYSTPVAEMGLALLLALVKKLPTCLAFQASRVWPDTMLPYRGESLRGRVAGIIGYGSIGREMGRLVRALGMTVLACKRHPEVRAEKRFHLPGTGDPDGLIPEAWYGFDRVQAMLPRCDVLFVCLPAAPGTKRLLGREHLAALPPHALIVNIGRGTVFDEPALAECLREGRLAGAGLDVFAEEPLPAASPLWGLSNVVLSPHIASYTSHQATLAGEVLIENLRRDLAKEPLLNLVNFAEGY